MAAAARVGLGRGSLSCLRVDQWRRASPRPILPSPAWHRALWLAPQPTAGGSQLAAAPPAVLQLATASRARNLQHPTGGGALAVAQLLPHYASRLLDSCQR